MGTRQVLATAAVFSLLLSAPANAAPKLHFVKKIGVGSDSNQAWMSFVAFSPDGRRVASDGPATPGDVSGALTIRRFPRGTLLKTLPGRPQAVARNWRYYFDGKQVRDMTSGAPVLPVPDAQYETAAFSPDGAWIAVTSERAPYNNHIEVLAVQGGRRIAVVGTHMASALAIDPRRAILAAGGWDIVTLWDLHSGKRLGALHGIGRYVRSLAFSRDGRHLAAGTDLGGVQLWDVRRRRRLWSRKLDGGEVSEPAFGPDGRLVAVGVYGTGTAFLIDGRTGRLLDRKKISDIGCGAVAFSPDGRTLIAPSTGGLIEWPYDTGGTIRVFKVER
jgi:WD40 repeat protein